MAILLVLGGIILLLGILFLIDGGILKKIQDALNKPLFKSDEQFAYKHRIPLGIFLMAVGGTLLFIAFSLK